MATALTSFWSGTAGVVLLDRSRGRTYALLSMRTVELRTNTLLATLAWLAVMGGAAHTQTLTPARSNLGGLNRYYQGVRCVRRAAP